MLIYLKTSKIKKISIATAILISIAGCKTMADKKDANKQNLTQPQNINAIVKTQTTQSHAELITVLTQALNGVTPIIAKDALTQESILIIEKKRPQTIQNMPMSGRITEKPHRFNLIISGGTCYLVDVRSKKHYPLKKTQCQPK